MWTDPLAGGGGASPWPELAAYNYVESLLTTTQETDPQDATLSPDGLSLYMIGTDTGAVQQYALAEPWTLAGATAGSSFSVLAQDIRPFGVAFSPDGLHLFITGNASDRVYRYDLGTAWDLSTASLVHSKSLAAEDGAPKGLAFSPDGLYMFMAGVITGKVFRYALSPAWDVETATLLEGTALLATYELSGLEFNSNGTKLYLTSRATNILHYFELTEPWDTSTAASVSTRDLTGQVDVLESAEARGNDLYVVGRVDSEVHRFTA